MMPYYVHFCVFVQKCAICGVFWSCSQIRLASSHLFHVKQIVLYVFLSKIMYFLLDFNRIFTWIGVKSLQKRKIAAYLWVGVPESLY